MTDLVSYDHIDLTAFNREYVEAVIDLIMFAVPTPTIGTSAALFMLTGFAG